MGHRTLEVNLISARGLKHVNLFSKMDVYTVVSITGGAIRDEKKTPVDRQGNTNPTWNISMKFSVDESALEQNRLTLEFVLRCERSLGNKDVGEVNVPVKELLNGAKESTRVQFVQYQVRKPSGKPKGELSFSYKFEQKKVEKRKGMEMENMEVVQTANVVRTGNMYPSLDEITGGIGDYPLRDVLPVYRLYYTSLPELSYGYSQVQPQRKNMFGLGSGLLGGTI